ncbi:hypothetical protein [Pseudidiomarina sp.]|uniref:hypothetical protein n=1 Tax=Pseudidiomarina sp. TaxID=2081707 RepID=UPI003A9696E7
MKTYSLVVRQLSESIHYVQNQLRLPLVSQNSQCAEFELADDSRLALCSSSASSVIDRSAKCLPLSKRLLSALERNGGLFSHQFVLGAARNCELPVRLRVPGHSDVRLCQECVAEPKAENTSRSSFWSGLNKVFVDLVSHHGYRM